MPRALNALRADANSLSKNHKNKNHSARLMRNVEQMNDVVRVNVKLSHVTILLVDSMRIVSLEFALGNLIIFVAGFSHKLCVITVPLSDLISLNVPPQPSYLRSPLLSVV